LQSHVSQLGGREKFPERMRTMATLTGAAWNVGPAEAFRYLELG